MATKYDAIIIGTGQSGPSLAARLAGARMSVAIIERKLFGGTCVNTGCIPTKTLVASARAAYMARRGADFGVMIDGTVFLREAVSLRLAVFLREAVFFFAMRMISPQPAERSSANSSERPSRANLINLSRSRHCRLE